MITRLATAVFLLMTASPSLGQGIQGVKQLPEDVEYEPVEGDPFPGFEKAALIVDYYFSSGISLGDRYKYEIIVTDRTLLLEFNSPGTDSYKKVTFNKKRTLTVPEARELSRVIGDSHLVQVRDGVPRPRYSGHTREVLIVRSKDLKIAGGMCHSNIFENSRSPREIEVMIQSDRAECSSIGGDYDAVIGILRSLFPELKKLISQAEGAQ